MATLAELIHDRTALAEPAVEHLQRLVGTWGVLSDLSFSDLLLFAPAAGQPGQFVVVGQVRPTTSQTLYIEDLLGREVTGPERPMLSRALSLGTVVEGELAVAARGEPARVVCIPVRFAGEVVAVLTREAPLRVGRRPGELERVYAGVFDRIARMVTAGAFPFLLDEPLSSESPRVGDGVMVLDASGRVEYASPNAVNAMHRLGVFRGVLGASLEELGLEQSPVPRAYKELLPASEELELGEVAVFIRCIPLLDQGKLTGALVLVRDVTDIRRRDRLLMSKDVAIREVHHRVKNNLQTISSLLRLQARRLPAGEARHALDEAERRVRSIAMVHEILSRDTAQEVDFDDILPSLVRMAEDLSSTAHPVRVTWSGGAGHMGAQVATPLAVALNELMQNAVEHAFVSYRAEPEARVHVTFSRRGDELVVEVRDNGAGLPPGFSVDSTTSLGLSIVRGLVNSQLGGKIEMRSDGGTVARLVVPINHPVGDDLARI
ncbi:MAG: histidine kinase N-terminal domain-containing protein [Actinomycetota bacterium]|jgi:two-component sensor histidine kinase|nr:histidine kinase N-terminal domain-containing protein [Actinomycetota bacterium]